MPTHRIRHFPKELPRTPCTPVMYERIIAIADKRGLSIAEVQREALSLFLAEIDRKIVSIDNKTVGQEERVERAG